MPGVSIPGETRGASRDDLVRAIRRSLSHWGIHVMGDCEEVPLVVQEASTSQEVTPTPEEDDSWMSPMMLRARGVLFD